MNEGLYTLLGAAIAGLVALVGIWTREQALDRHRFTERKQVLYTDLWIAADRHKREVEAQLAWRRDQAAGVPGEDPGVGDTEPARMALKALELLAPPVVVARATDFYGLTATLGAMFVSGDPSIVQSSNLDAIWRDVELAWRAEADTFLDAARADLAGG